MTEAYSEAGPIKFQRVPDNRSHNQMLSRLTRYEDMRIMDKVKSEMGLRLTVLLP